MVTALEKLPQIGFADIRFLRQGLIAQFGVLQIFFDILHYREQGILAVLRGGGFSQKTVKNAEDLSSAAAKSQKAPECFAIPQTTLRIAQGDRHDLVAAQAGTLEIDNRENAFLITMNVVIATHREQNRIVWIGFYLLRAHGIGQLPAYTEGQAKAGPILHPNIPVFGEVNIEELIYRCYYDILKQIH